MAHDMLHVIAELHVICTQSPLGNVGMCVGDRSLLGNEAVNNLALCLPMLFLKFFISFVIVTIIIIITIIGVPEKTPDVTY